MAEIFGAGLVKGLSVTLKTLFKRPITTQYPEQKLTVSRRARGTVLAWSAQKCTGCYTCEHACPHGSINIKTEPQGIKHAKKAPCTNRCPAHVDAARYIRSIIAGKPGEAVAIIRESIPFPSVCAYICAHPCESACSRAEIDEPIAIRKLKRYAVDNDDGAWRQKVKKAAPSDKKVAVIGAGPAGLTAAYYLARKGHSVTVFEALSASGGMMKVGIPDYRLPPQILEADIKEIETAGVNIELNTSIESFDQLLQSGFNATFVGVGAHHAITMGIPGEDTPGVLSGVDFLRDVNLGKPVKIGERVAVIGGGNSAIDCVRTAVRLGAGDVSLIYRRIRAEMPAAPEEVTEALEEGVKLVFLAAPTRIISEDGRLILECVKMQLGAEDSSGRHRPEPIPGSEYRLELDNIISSVSQSPVVPETFGIMTNKAGRIDVVKETLATAIPGVFAGGDAVLGPATVIECIAQGRLAAEAIDQYLGGNGNISEILAEPEALLRRDGGPTEDFRPAGQTISHEKRTDTFDNVEIGWNRETALTECSRCLRCDLSYKPKKWTLKGGQCIYCGLCVEACPFDALYMGYEYERNTYTTAAQTLDKEQLLTPEVRKPSGYYHPEIAGELPEQTLLLERDK